MLQVKVFISKRLSAVNGDGSGAVAVEKISALYHEVFDLKVAPSGTRARRRSTRWMISAYHAMKFAPFVALWLAGRVFGLAGAELSEILSGLWHDVCE
jgi:hypothetical protein